MKTSKILCLAIVATVMVTIIAFLPRAVGQDLSWRVGYDSQGRIAQRIDPPGRVTNYTYTPVSNEPARRCRDFEDNLCQHRVWNHRREL